MLDSILIIMIGLSSIEQPTFSLPYNSVNMNIISSSTDSSPPFKKNKLLGLYFLVYSPAFTFVMFIQCFSQVRCTTYIISIFY